MDLSERLNKVASSMLKCLCLLEESSIINFDDSSIVDLNELPDRNTLLFTSSEYMTIIKNIPRRIERIFVLESDQSQADYQNRFATGEDLIFQLADELYRCYKLEADDSSKLGDSVMAEMKKKQADKIHDELGKTYKSVFKSDNVAAVVVTSATTVMWLKSKSQKNIEMGNLQSSLSQIVSSVQSFDNTIDCHNSLRMNELWGSVFLVIDPDYEDSTKPDFHQFRNVQAVYRCTETLTDNDDNLAFQLFTGLAIHYQKLGAIYSARQDPKTAKDMFLKVSELYDILAKF